MMATLLHRALHACVNATRHNRTLSFSQLSRFLDVQEKGVTQGQRGLCSGTVGNTEVISPAESVNNKSVSMDVAIDTGSEQETDHLSYINLASFQDLRSNYKLAPSIAKEIIKHIREHGPLRDLSDLISIRNVGPKTIEKITKVPSKEPDNLTRSRRSNDDNIFKMISPSITHEDLQNIETVTSLEVCLDGIYYGEMTRDLNVTHWGHIPYGFSCSQYKVSAAQMLEEVMSIIEQLPKSDIYVMENRSSKRVNQNFVQLFLFVSRIQSILYTLLNKDLSTTKQHRVYHIADSFIVLKYKLRVGGDRMSSQHILDQIVAGEYPQEINIEDSLLSRYTKLNSWPLKERYSNSLLLSLAFCESFLNVNS